MTREEFMEDAQVGQVVKIYTVTGDIYLGSVDSFGPSGVKIIQIENNVPKRIMYERISEYDVDVEEQALKTSALEKSLYAIDRSAIFSSKGIDISFAYIINLFESLIDKKDKSGYARVQDIIDYAKKIDEYERTSDRVIKAIAELKILSEQNALFKLYIAAIQFDFNDFRASADNCFACKQYELAFYLYKKAADREMMFKSAALSISSTKDEYIIRWLCEYAVKINNGQIIKKIVMENDSYANEAMIYWFCTSALLADVDSIEQARLDVNIKKMKEAINKIGDAGAEIFSFTHEMQKTAQESPSKEQNSKRTGTISYYNRNGGNGYIRENDGNTIYFYIKQVKDYELQKILSVSDNVWIRVT